MISAPLIEYLKKGIFTLLGLILAVYLFVILMTYTGNDPSWSHISSDMTTINNMGGETGAWLSDLLYSFFGFGAWWLLAFVVYESILIWWDNKPTFWLMRLVAYVFLLLSTSALFAQLVALVQQVADPVSTGLKGVAGGIIGLELQARLAQLLSQWGSVVFLTVFVIITATFAFNIHWLSIYQKVTALSWLGSGVKRKEFAQDDGLTTKENMASEQKDDSIEGNQEKEIPQYEQLPLELQSADAANNAQVDSGRFSNVLSDFLSTSGLADSVRASMAAAQATISNQPAASNQAAHSNAVPNNGTSSLLQSSEVSPSGTAGNLANNTASTTNAVTTLTPVTTPVRKVEPSFAWNDASTVEDLLASEQAAYDTNVSDVAVPATSYADTESLDESVLATSNLTVEPAAQPVTGNGNTASSSTANSRVENENTVNENTANDSIKNEEEITQQPVDESIDPTTESVDTLAEGWLAEHADVATSMTSDSVVSEPVVFEADASDPAMSKFKDNEVVGSDPVEKTSVNTQAEQTASLSHAAATPTAAATETNDQQPISNITAPVVGTVDMTPTNTPPANPKEAPTAKTINTTTSTQSETAAKPTVSFAVPEGDSSNHITDMMPDDDADDEIAAPVMPDISDDTAFSQKSRSMQTAAYRSSLTPIPEVSILDKPDPDRKPSYTIAELDQLSELLEIKLQEFNVKATVVNAIPGPVVTRFEVELAAGVKASKVTGISRDLARSLSMASLRVVEVIPGKPYIGIEVPNKKREMVRLIELLNTETFKDPKAQISMAMGKDIGGNPIITDLARAPHMLVAGTTGSGKSVLVNSMLLSMLLKYTPNELRLILIDPKQLELANYNDIPHLLTPVVTDMTEAASALSWCVAEMERRYQLMSLLKVRKLNEFNKKVIAAEKSGNPMLDPLWRPNDSVSISQAPKLKTLPMIVIVADEFADMIMQVGKQAEELITRLAQKSRAAGIHLMLATQRPSVDVITGLIKANIPVRAALRVNSKVDSRTILDSGGAEDMLGNGDMLFLGPGQIEPDRVHGAYVSDEEVNRVCDAWRERGAPDYIDNMAGNFELSSPGGGSAGNASGEDDDLYNDAVAFIMETRKVSASSIQRKFSIGYNRAARIVDSMEEAGLVSSMGKSGKRELLM
ncbi:DNA translocase FtsK 4TM domain-containing protein [Psychrobacter sp. APC 3426]|uniref:DNA translocase FtsK n=1 Tax=Psychrobacter sp. APC 3426 TaxID=3035177 RepID=UPI0025B58B01|nr:DNA translocase FtsK 4TM domain-containing protein [Psychrobacter sp. APC 3426]MDN3399220.1 DNA translocase FtsK 4TM domain-containing protein [Psychrobacter sp. APC 3426]